MKPTKPNRTKKMTASDIVMTPLEIARQIVGYFKPKGRILEPAKGSGNFLRVLPFGTNWCEITEGKDFFDWEDKVDWIITNPPYSIYDIFLKHCFEVSDNVVLLAPIAKAFKSMKIESLVDKYGGLKEIVLLGGGGRCGFAFGFPVGCLYYQRGYRGDIKRTVLIDKRTDRVQRNLI